MSRFRIAGVAMTVICVAVSDAAAQLAPPAEVNWLHAFVLQGRGGITNPIVRVGFDPQPDPPATAGASLLQENPLMPRLKRSSNGHVIDQFFDVFFAIGGTRDPLTTGPMQIVGRSSVKFDVFASGLPIFSLFFDVSTSNGGMGQDWVGLNPQPEVPSIGLFGPDAYGGASFKFSSFSDLYVDVRLYDARGTQLALTAVPEPGTLLLLGFGLAMTGWVGRRRSRGRLHTRNESQI